MEVSRDHIYFRVNGHKGVSHHTRKYCLEEFKFNVENGLTIDAHFLTGEPVSVNGRYVVEFTTDEKIAYNKF